MQRTFRNAPSTIGVALIVYALLLAAIFFLLWRILAKPNPTLAMTRPLGHGPSPTPGQ